ncbi:hypothetical protein WHI96_26295 [Pseudonocardia tropica]|uniref:Uncharacterized protein n=1 Tax=Pseudonocardia tropica TaxID=681289 RepID=A0ABV1K3B9_9PSEU
MIIPVGTLPAGADPVDLAALLERLRGDRARKVRPIGRAAAPEAIAATLTEPEIADLVHELGGRATVVSDTPIDL